MHGKSQNFSLFIRDFDRHLFFNSLSQFNGTIDLVWDGKKLMRQLNGVSEIMYMFEIYIQYH